MRGEAARIPIPQLPPDKRLTALEREQALAAFNRYAASLAAVSNAKDREEFNAAGGKLTAALGGMASTAASLSGIAAPVAVAVGPAVVASGNVALWLVGAELDRRRYETLRNGVIAACDSVRVLAKAVGIMFDEQRGDRLDQLVVATDYQLRRVNRARDRRAADDAMYGALIEELRSLVNDYNAARGLNPVALGEAVVAAHDKLVVAISTNQGQFAEISKAFEALGDEIGKLQEAVGKLDAASDAARRR